MKTAVCFTGNGRSIFALDNHGVFKSLRKNVIDCWEDRDVYYILGANEKQDEIQELFSTIDNCSVTITCHEDLNIDGINFAVPNNKKEIVTSAQSLAKFLYKRKVLGETLKASNVKYDRVIISRDDVIYDRPLSHQVKGLDLSKIWIPSWGHHLGGFNDRFSISNQTLQQLYCQAWDHRGEVNRIHIESFYRYCIEKYIGSHNVGLFHTEFKRIRPSGNIENNDINLKGQAPYNPNNHKYKLLVND